MNDNPSNTAASDEAGREPLPHDKQSHEPQPWERQTGEPLDRYRWFQIYLTLPQPRLYASVSETVGLSSGSRLVSQAASRWRWKQRAAASDNPDTGCLPLQAEWRNQLIREAAYLARFTGLEDTNRALATADIGQMDRIRARRYLDPLFRHQQGLIRLIAPPTKYEDLEIDEEWLKELIRERARELWWEVEEKLLRKIYAEDGKESETDIHETPAEEDPEETKPWLQQTGEQAKYYSSFQIYLSLMFFQSIAQVASMANYSGNSTLAKIARKWRWPVRAAAFEDHLADNPLARFELQEQLLLDKVFDALLHGLLDSTKALKNADIGRLDRPRARNLFSLISRRQRSLLHLLWRQNEAVDRETLEERRKLIVAPLVEERARNLPPTEDEKRSDEILTKFYGKKEDDE